MSQPVPTATPVQQYVTDPYGSGATFSWGGSSNHIPQPGDADYVQYNQALNNWLQQRYQTYLQSPKYMQDQAANNPDIASGRVPAVGYVGTPNNAWGIPEGSRVTALNQQQGGGYQIGYTQPTTPQQVSIQGPGYGAEFTVMAPDAQIATQMALAGYKNQTAGMDTSPSKIGGYVSSMNVGKPTVIQAGNPEQNDYWVKQGLPQYAAYTPPSVSGSEKEQGFYIKDISANGTAPKVTVGNTQYENFWQQQGHPEFSNYRPPALQAGQYIYNPTVNSQGELSYGVGNKSWEQQWASLGVTDVNTIRGYQPPSSLPQGSYVTDLTQNSQGLNYKVGNTNWEKQWASLGVTDVNTIRGYAPPENLSEGSYVKDVRQSSEGLQFQIGNTISEAKLASINTQLDTINQQNQLFTKAYNLGVEHPDLIGKKGSGAISLTEYQQAMNKQNQNTVGVLGEAESSGFISASEKQAEIAQLNTSLQSVNNLATFSNASDEPKTPLPEVYWENRATQKPSSNGLPNISPLGPEPGSAQYNQQGSWLNLNPSKVEAKASGNDAFKLISTLASEPIETIRGLLNPVAFAVAKDNSSGGQVAQLLAGSASYYVNTATEVKDTITGKEPVVKKYSIFVNSVPNAIPNPSNPKIIPAYSETESLGYKITEVGNAVTASVVLPAVAPSVLPIAASTIVKAGVLNAVLTEGITYVASELDKNPETKYSVDASRISQSFLIGEGVAVTGVGALKAVSKADPAIAASRVGQAGINVAVGGGTGYVLSGGDPAQTIAGAATAGLLSIGAETIIRPITSGLKTKFGYTRLVESEPTIGKSGTEVPAYVTEKPVATLGDRQLRVVYDVTENPVGTKGVTIESMQTEYVNKQVPTAHATLNSKAFNLRAGGETTLKGFPEEGAGYRAENELYHFYSAPGSDKYVNVYGGYAGMSQSEESAFRLVVGGKPTVLVTTETKISSKFNPLSGESESAYLSRTSKLPGETGIAQETILGKSMERQFVTTSSYERFGEPLVGSKFVSEGSAGKFQIQELPQGRLGKVPVVREMFSRYTDFKVVKGKYLPNESPDVIRSNIDVLEYNKTYERTINASTTKSPVFINSFASGASDNAVSALSLSKEVMPSDLQPSLTSSNRSQNSLLIMNKSLSSLPSEPVSSAPSINSQQSYPSTQSAPSYPSQPSAPSIPSLTSTPSKPSPSTSSLSIPSSTPSYQSQPSIPNYSAPNSAPSYPSLSLPSTPSAPYSSPLYSPPISPQSSSPRSVPPSSPFASPPPSPFSSYFDIASDQPYSKKKSKRGSQRNSEGYLSIPREYPILTGKQLLGNSKSGDEQPFF